MPAKKEISLLPDQENQNTPVARILRWATTVGRFIIVFTELIVVGAFLSRFWLDRRNSDISEVLRQQKAILESTQDFEREYNLFQQRIKVIKDAYSSRPDYSSKIISLITSTPPDLVYDNLTFSSEGTALSASLSVSAYQEDTVVSFIKNLSLNPAIKSVDIKNIEKKTKESKYSVNLFLIFNAPAKT